MPIYDGIVTVDENDIPVIVEINERTVRMSAGGNEIGEWPAEECEISHLTESRYTISAENETLEFTPNRPSLFAAAVNGGQSKVVAVAAPVDVDDEVPLTEPAPTEELVGDGDQSHIREAPAPKPMTMSLFYALCIATAALAVWSLISIIF